MEEQQLKFSRNDDLTLVVLDEEAKQELMKEVKDLHFSSGELYNNLKNDTLEKGFNETLMTLLESYTVKIHKCLGYESVLQKEHDDRYVEIRSLNSQNRELRKQLGDKCSPEDVREKLKTFKEEICDWWKKEGLGYISEIAFHPYACIIKVSGSMTIHYEKTQPEYLKEKGYELIQPERGAFCIKHSENNINLLTSEVKKRFPSARLSKIELSNYHGLHIRDAEYIIKNFDDIETEK